MTPELPNPSAPQGDVSTDALQQTIASVLPENTVVTEPILAENPGRFVL
ncbi:MAG: hypothetical protein RJA19_377, partial [Bacteroidota bacterium]